MLPRNALVQGRLSAGFPLGPPSPSCWWRLALIGVAGYYNDPHRPRHENTSLSGSTSWSRLGFAGASLISIFSRLGGGIFTTGPTSAATWWARSRPAIPEDDPHPRRATISNKRGRQILRLCSELADDLFETYAVTTVATMVLAAIFFPRAGTRGRPPTCCCCRWPSAAVCCIITTSIIAQFAVRAGQNNNIMAASTMADRHRRPVGQGLDLGGHEDPGPPAR